MNSPIAIVAMGVVTSVGNSAAATYAAVRAKVANPTITRFRANQGEWIIAHQAEATAGLRGIDKLAAMAAHAILDCLTDAQAEVDVARLPLLLCVAEHSRPGRLEEIDRSLFTMIEGHLGICFHSAHSRLIAAGRVGALIALSEARDILRRSGMTHVLIAATDSLLVAGTLAALCEQERILTPENSNGFIPGEGAGAVLVGCAGDIAHDRVACLGFGEGREEAAVMSEEPLRGKGLLSAVRAALDDGGVIPFEAIDVRICDVSGEQYGFKEAALVAGRMLRVRRPNQDLWHPAEVVGEIGSAIGPVMIAVAASGLRKGLLGAAPVLVHAGNDDGRRAACVMRLQGTQAPSMTGHA